MSKASESQPSTEYNTTAGAQPSPAKNNRRLPFPYDSSLNTLTPTEHSHPSIPLAAPPSRSRQSSQDSARSASSNVLRKIGPPVPQKPILLSNSGDQNLGKHSQTVPSQGQDIVVSTAARPLPILNAGIPHQILGKKAGIRDHESARQRPPEDSGPPLPPRKTQQSQNPLGLMDDDIEGAGGIPSLQPQRQP